MMKKALIGFMAFVTVFIGGSISGGASTSPPPEGGVLPDFTLPVPQEPEHRAYLGLQEEALFAIPDIEAQVVIIELFSMYCPHCQREAPTVNQLYARIEGDPNLKNKVKIIGIGIGNSAYEVAHFRKTYAVPFPLFADGDFALHKKLGEVRTPFFIGVRIKDDGGHEVFYSQLGGPQDAGTMLEALLDRSGLR